jgi:hypothetical protein
MRIQEVVREAISRRGFLQGLGAAAAGIGSAARAGQEPNEEDVYWGVRKDYTDRPRKLIPNTTVDRPNQYIPELNAVIYDKGIFNAMDYRDFVFVKSTPGVEFETVAPGTNAGINEKALLTQLGEYNYFVTQTRVEKFAQEYNVEQLSKRYRDAKQRMARGDTSFDRMSRPVPPGSTFDPGHIQQPQMPWQINQVKNI